MMKAQSKECSAFGGAIFLCNHLTRKECFDKKIFGLSQFCAEFIEKVKAGTTLFLYDVEQCKLHGVFEATSDGAVNIIPDAFVSSGKRYPSQIRFKRIWFCKPLMLSEFQDAVQNYSINDKFSYGLSHQQVVKLLRLFSSRKRLQLHQNPRLQDDLPRELETSSLAKVTDVQSSPNSSSCGSFRSPCKTCSSTTLGEHTASLGDKLMDPMAAHRGLQSNVFEVAKPKNSKSPLHTATVTIPSNQEAMPDQSTDDYIPLSKEEDNLEGVDDLFVLLKAECHSSESKGSSDSEDHTTFHQVRVRKEDGCYPPILNSKLRADSEGRTSVFSRIVQKHEIHNHGKRFKTEAILPRGAESSYPLYQRKKQQKAQRNKPFPYHSDGMRDMHSADRLNRDPASNRSFVWRRSTKFSEGKQSEIQTGLGTFLCEDGNKQDVSNKQPARFNTCKKTFDPKGCPKLIDSCDQGLNMPTVFGGVYDCTEFNVKEEMGTPSLNFKRHANDFCSEDVEGEGSKKRRATASFHQEHPNDTALITKGTKTMDMLALSDENFKRKSVTLSSKDIYTQLAVPYLDAKVLLQNEQHQSFQCCFESGEDITCDSSLILESSKTMDMLATNSFGVTKTLLNSDMAADYLSTETSLQQKETQKIKSCHRVVNGDKILLLGKSGTVDFLPSHDEDCENKILPSDESGRPATSCHLETEMPLLQKQTPNVLSCAEVVHDDEVLAEIPEEMSPKFDSGCVNQVTSLVSGYREEVCHVKGYCEVVPSNAAPVLEGFGPLNNFPRLCGDSSKTNILFDETSEHVPPGHQDTIKLPHDDEHHHSCCGDTSSVLEYITVDTGSGGGVSEHKKSSDQKDDETLYLLTGSKDHICTTSTFSRDGSRRCAPTDEQECSKVMLLEEQNFQSNSSSMDSFGVSSEGCGSKSGISASRPSVHQVADLLGTNSESRTSFINDFPSESAETFSTSALGSEDGDHNVNISEAYTEPPILQHDPGEAVKQL